ncbi:type II secretion system minor pseudopilin GspK [Undibacterium sp. TS12]|uniref:type II secretion system minor pseudopilin GspK n=1 Tax=Undibacterium sp. TS12 TaxID=2908202 RepID=UPI001F4CFB30|nr:type II secretion system minor pseudopilin GspK [Undibacterium sp. TS12]MCH8618852.1 type II secretion system minor pseudopilin GspK [Undibacterium sp. TS12]
MTTRMDVLRHQRGVAVITALLLTTLAITIVASLFWQQQVQVRSIENQRMQLQKKWILRGAIDWARLILREDGRQSANVDHLGEPWAVTLADTRLDQYVENARTDGDDSDATLSGQVVDAQAMYNLNNLATDGYVDQREVDAFARLLVNLRFDGQLAQSVADMVAKTQVKAAVPSSSAAETGPVKSPVDGAGTAVQFLRFTQVDDLLAVNGFTPEMMERIKAFVTVLPRKTAINVNTTFPEVLAARIEGLSVSDAAMIIASRDRAYFRTLDEFKSRFEERVKAVTVKDVAVSTNFFIVNGKVKMNRSALDVSALIERADNATTSNASTTVLWVKEN